MEMPFKKLSVPVTLPIKFRHGDELRHQKGGTYTIVGVPTDITIEETGEPAYAYQGRDGRIWIRSQSKMEDGRFILVATALEVEERKEKKTVWLDHFLLFSLLMVAAVGFWYLKTH